MKINDNYYSMRVKKGYILFIKALFSDPNFDPTLFNYRCIKLAREHNRQILIDFMLTDSRFKRNAF